MTSPLGRERPPEEDRSTAKRGGGEGVGAAEDQAEEIEGGGMAFVVGNLLDPEGFDTGDAVMMVHG